MPFALHSMGTHCAVIALADTAEEAWAACDARGLPRDRALVLPCAMGLAQAAAVADETAQLRLKLSDARQALADQREKSEERMERTRDRLATAEATIEHIRRSTDDAALKRLTRIRDEVTAAVDALDPSRLVLTRPAQETA